MSKTLVHVTFDEVKEFVPRVPRNRCAGEDYTIPRICVSDRIENALMSIPQAGIVLKNATDIGIPVILHAYYLSPEEDGYMPNSDIFQYVPDAETTRESWLTKTPKKIFRVDYIITKALTVNAKDVNGVPITLVAAMDRKRTKYANNWDLFFKNVSGYIPEESSKYCRSVLFKSFMISLDENTIRKLKEKVLLNKERMCHE